MDLHFLDRPHAIATAVIQGGGSLALVDPGPSTCLDALDLGLQQQGLRVRDVTHLLLTHIPAWTDRAEVEADAKTTWDGPLDLVTSDATYEL